MKKLYMKTNLTILIFIFVGALGFSELGFGSERSDFASAFDYFTSEGSNTFELQYTTPYSEVEAKTTIDSIMGTGFLEVERPIWENDKRTSYRSANAKFVYYKPSGTFHYVSDNFATHYCDSSYSDKSFDSSFIAGNAVQAIVNNMDINNIEWEISHTKSYYTDSGTEDGPNNDHQIIMSKVVYYRIVNGHRTIGPGSIVAIYVSTCGDIVGIKMNWRKIDEYQPLLQTSRSRDSNEQILSRVDDIKQNYSKHPGDSFQDETLECGFYEELLRKEASSSIPFCSYTFAHHSYSKSADSLDVAAYQLLIDVM